MQTYTKQQRQGGGRYGARTLVGNWIEDVELQGSSIKDFLAKRETGRLKVDNFQDRTAVALTEVEHTRIADDPYIHYGDVLQLLHSQSGCYLACDVEDKVRWTAEPHEYDIDTRPGEMSCSATATASITHPVARNTFLLHKYVPSKPSPLEPSYPDDILRYGQKFRLIANPMAQVNVGRRVDGLEGSGGTPHNL
eukprot:jgi/Chrzof1/7866/Cz02g39110.t1